MEFARRAPMLFLAGVFAARRLNQEFQRKKMSLKLHFLRHGQTGGSRDNVFCGSGTDAPLTPHGEAMAREFASAYAGTAWRAIYCSPQSRAIATATPLATQIRAELQVRDGLREIGYGAWEGRSVAEVQAAHHDDYLRWTADPAWNAPTSQGEKLGESAGALAQRVLAVIEEITENIDGGNVLLVSHKATIRVALCALLGIDVGRFRFRFAAPVASLAVVEFGAHGPLLQRLADRAHLSQELRDLPGT
jgi:broad specificity phosphatase PhoE